MRINKANLPIWHYLDEDAEMAIDVIDSCYGDRFHVIVERPDSCGHFLLTREEIESQFGLELV
jgi:hypothetical protein